MADTIPDVPAPANDWVNIYTLTGISVGTSVTITNKSSYEVLIQERATKPLSDNVNGKVLATINTGTYQATVTGTPTGIWVKSSGKNNALINIQEL